MHSQSSSISSLDAISYSDMPEFHFKRKRKATVYRKRTMAEPVREMFLSMHSVIERFSSFGRYQMFCCIIVLYSTLFWSGNFLILPHTITDNSWSCYSPSLNETQHLDVRQPGFCQKIVNCTSQRPPNHSYFYSTIIEWGLVCDKRLIPSVLMLCYLCGRLIGCLFGGHLADYCGRVWGYELIQSVLLVSSMMTIASTDWIAFATFQLFNGFIFGHMQTTCVTLLVETTDGKYRFIPLACIQWGLGFTVNAVILYLANDWRMFIIIVNLISSPLLYFYLLLQESYRWLLAKGNREGAAQTLSELNSERWAKYSRPQKENDSEINESQLSLLVLDDVQKLRFYTCFHLLLKKSTCRTTVVLMLTTTVYGMVSSWFYSSEALTVNIYIHVLLYGILTFWICSCMVAIDLKIPKLGYKSLLLFNLSVLALCFAISLFLHLTSYRAPRHIIYAATSIATVTSSSMLLMIISHTAAAFYPTIVRCTAFGLLFACENLGSIAMTILRSVYFTNGLVIGSLVCEALIIGVILLAILYFPETKFSIKQQFLADDFPSDEQNMMT